MCLSGSFLQVCEKKKNKEKMKKLGEFLQACISGMASTIFFKLGM